MFEKGVRLKAELGEENVYDFSLGNPNNAPPPAFFKALRDCAAETDPGAHRYMNNAGFDETRRGIAGMLKREYGIPFAAPQVIAACGAAGGIEPAFSEIKQLLRSAAPRSVAALWRGMQPILDQITPSDAAGFFRQCGYAMEQK
jgi:hypothetical protein